MADTIKGLDTIMECVGPWPKQMQIDARSLYDAQLLKDRWNDNHIAFLPFCMKCKQPLNWIREDPSDIFQCSQCGTKWVKSDSWKEDFAKLKKELNG